MSNEKKTNKSKLRAILKEVLKLRCATAAIFKFTISKL